MRAKVTIQKKVLTDERAGPWANCDLIYFEPFFSFSPMSGPAW
jgi:hypothetical protein